MPGGTEQSFGIHVAKMAGMHLLLSIEQINAR
jgi:DNA mismatch repair ATPase MutS